MYFTETDKTDFIQGVQGRYFIPAFMLITLILDKIKKNKSLLLVEKCLILFLPHLNLLVLIQMYYFFY